MSSNVVARTAVVDCSVAASWFMPDESSPERDRILDDIISGKLVLILPDLWWYEMANLLKSASKRKRITAEEANRIMFFLREVDKEVVPSDEQGQPGILNLAITADLSAYDAAYLHLSLTAGSLLITADKGILRLKESHENILTPEEYCAL